jgi:hypothetical protein
VRAARAINQSALSAELGLSDKTDFFVIRN